MDKLQRTEFKTEKIKVNNIFTSHSLKEYNSIPFESRKIKEVYGDNIRFPKPPEDRPYVFASFVTSIDGKLAYVDEPSAFYVAAKNILAGDGSMADFWLLNALRGVCDASIIGGNSLHTDDDYSMHIYDEDIEKDRIKHGLPQIPLNIVISLDATDIPLEHKIFKDERIPTIIATSPAGLEHIEKNMKQDYVVLGPYVTLDEVENNKEEILNKLIDFQNTIVPVVITGEGGFPNASLLMKILREIGVVRLLIESPGYGNYLIKQKIMDELFLNLSCVYIGGGDTMTLGKGDKGFLSTYHPHTEVLSIHSHSPHFFFLRHRLIYDVSEK